MNMLVLHNASRLILPVALAFSWYLLLRGHNEPGGGFIGGLVAGAGLAVHGVARGRVILLRTLRLAPATHAAIGLVLALVSGLAGIALGQPFLTHQWGSGPFGIALGTTLVFDIGVYFAVVGAVTGFVSSYLPER